MKGVKVIIIWLLVWIIMLSLLIIFPYLIGYATNEEQPNIINLTSCQTLTTSNAIYYLQNDVSAAGTCFNIMADNIILDGQGFTVNYSNLVLGHAINTSGRYGYGQGSQNLDIAARYKNLTIRNLKIIQNSSRGAGINNAYGIFTYNAERIEIINNDITSYSGLFITNTNDSIIANNKIVSNNSHGLSFNAFKYSTVKDNEIITFGSSNFNYGISLFYFSSNNTIANNKISTNGGQTNSGINLEYDVANNTITNNDISTNGTSNFNSGIYLNGRCNGNLIKNNKINTNGLDQNNGYIQYDSNNNLLSNNDITTNGNSSNYGIYISGGSNANTTFVNNKITTNGVDNNYGVYFIGSYNNLTSNTITTNGNSRNYGVNIYAGTSNIIYKNTITTNGNSENHGIGFPFYSGNNTIKDNVVSTSGANSHALYLQLNSIKKIMGTNNTFDSNILSSSGLDLFFNSTNYTGSKMLIDQTIRDYFIGISSNKIYFIFKNSSSGEIKFLENIYGSSDDLSNDIQINNNLAFINESKAGLNKSANITFYNLPTSIVNFSIFRNGQICNLTSAPPCYNFTALNAGNVMFNITQGGNYTVKYDLINSSQRNLSNNDNGTGVVHGIIYELSEDEANKGIISTISSIDKIVIKYGDKRYEIIIQSINTTVILLNITNNAQLFALDINDSINVDVDNDDVFDYEVKLINIVNNKPSLFIKRLIIQVYNRNGEELILTSGGGEGTGEINERVSFNKGKAIYYFLIILFSIGIIIIIGLIIRFYIKSKEEKKMQSDLS